MFTNEISTNNRSRLPHSDGAVVKNMAKVDLLRRKMRIVEFEQNRSDRAEYGAQLLKKLEERLKTKGMCFICDTHRFF